MGMGDQNPTIQGATDGTEIGNSSDSLKVAVHDGTGTPITSSGGALNVNATVSTGATSDLLGSDTITALNDAVTFSTQGRSTVGLTVTGVWTATLVFEGTIDDTNWNALEANHITTQLQATSITANSSLVLSCGGFQKIRVRASAYTSGTATVAYDAAVGSTGLIIDPTYGNNSTTTPAQSQLIGGKYITGNTIVPIQVDDQGRLVTSALTGFGANFTFGDITTAALTQVAVNRTAYTEQTTNAQRSIASGSASDTAAGTGARTVTITYYTSAGVGPLTETVTLNGTAFVNTVNTDICFIENVKVATVGSNGSNVGLLTLKAATGGGGATIGTINIGNNQTFWAHHYVPTGKICNITGISCSHNGTTVGSGGVFILRARTIGVSNAVDIQVSDFVRLYGQSSTFSRTYQSPIKVTGPARLRILLTPESSSTIVYRAAIDFFEP